MRNSLLHLTDCCMCAILLLRSFFFQENKYKVKKTPLMEETVLSHDSDCFLATFSFSYMETYEYPFLIVLRPQPLGAQ